MSNIIGGGPGSAPINHLQFQQRATKSAFTRGDVGNLGKKETKTQERGDGLDGISKFERMPDGTSMTQFSDGSKQLGAPNGSTKDIDAEGNTKSLNLPNGMRVERDDDGSFLAFDPKTGDYGEVQTKDAPMGKIFRFEDSEGNLYEVGDKSLSFSVKNPSETLTQTVHTDGSMDISTKTLSRDPVKGQFTQDTSHVHIGADGETVGRTSGQENLAVNNQGISFTTRGDVDMGIKLPYTPPQDLKGEIVRPDMPPLTQDPSMPPPQQEPVTPQMPPNYGGPGCCPGGMPGGSPGMPEFYPGMPGMPGMPGNGYQQFPWAGYPMPGGSMPLPPGPMPGQAPPVNDPFAPIMTPGGMIRQQDPSGMFTISLPNGIVMNQLPDGKCQAFDARTPGQVYPVTTSAVENPGFGQETRYNFQDAEGNIVTMYSKSMDFAVASKNGNVLQTVSPNGDMMINARTYPPGQDGMPQMKNHKILIGADGRVNTFGEKGIQVNNKNVVFAESGLISNYKLPYEVPPHQGLMPYIPPIGYPANPAQPIPVMNPSQPSLYPGPDGMPMVGGQPPPIDGAATAPMDGEPDFPPGFEGEGAKEAGAPKTESAKADEAGKAEGKQEAPAEKPVKPGIWKRIKNFFTGDSNKAGKSGKAKHHGHCRGCHWGNPYPGGYYDPYGGMGMGYGMGMGMGGLGMGMGMGMGAGTAIGLGIGATAILAGSMMYPMGMFCNPFGMFGMYGMW